MAVACPRQSKSIFPWSPAVSRLLWAEEELVAGCYPSRLSFLVVVQLAENTQGGCKSTQQLHDGRASPLSICLVILTAGEEKTLPPSLCKPQRGDSALTPLLCPPTKLGKVGKFQHYVLIPPQSLLGPSCSMCKVREAACRLLLPQQLHPR